MWPNQQETADLVIFTEETINGKLHICAVSWYGTISFPRDLSNLNLFISTPAIIKKLSGPNIF